MVIGLRGYTTQSLFSKKRIDIICRQGGNVLIYSSQEIADRVAVGINGRILQVPLFSFVADLSKISSYIPPLKRSVYSDNYPSGGALAS